MNRFQCTLAVLAVCAAPAAAVAQDAIPDLKGTWTIDAAGMALAIPATGAAEPVDDSTEFVIDSQNGFRISGRETRRPAGARTPESGDNRFAGVIGTDNRTVSMVDEDGFRDCTILSDTRMDCIYRHVATDQAVVTRTTWTKRSD